jgi:hypothetical protein
VPLLRRAATGLVALSLAATLIGCSSLRLGYTFADTYLNYTLGTSFDLDDAQAALVREQVQALREWHRTTQLADYIAYLEPLQASFGAAPGGGAGRASGTATAGRTTGSSTVPPTGEWRSADVLRVQHDFNAKLLLIGEHAAPGLAQLALTLRPAQIDTFERKLGRDATKARDEARKRDTLDARVEHTVEQIETWAGALNGAQINVIRQVLASAPDLQALWLQERDRRDQDLLALLREVVRERPLPPVVARRLQDYFRQVEQPTEPARALRVKQRREAYAAMLAPVLNRMTAEQRAAMQRKLRGYAEDLAALAAD